VDIRPRTRQYSFELPLKTFPTFGSWKLRGDNISDLKRSENFEVNEKGDGWEFAFSKGTAVEAILHIMISITNEGQSYMRYGENRSAAALKFDDAKNIEKPFIMFRVEPRTEITSYNTIANKYDTLNIYHIVPYKTNDAVGSREEIIQAKDKLNSRRRLLHVLRNGGFKKRYEYIFTGLNTEILDYSIKFDRAWFVSLPIFQGQDRSSVLFSSGNMDPIKNGYRIVQTYGKSIEGTLKTLQENITDVKAKLDEDNLTTSERAALEEQQVKLQTNFTLIDTNREAIAAQVHVDVSSTNLDTSSWGADNKIQQISRLQDPNSQRANNAVNSNVVSLTDNNRFIGAEAERQAIAQRKAERAARYKGDGNVGSIFYVEDFSELSVQNNTTGVLDPNDVVILPPNELSPTIVDPDVGSEGAVSKGRSYFSAISNQIFGNKGQLISLDMTIRGDPYWLGEPNVDNRLKGYQQGDEARPADSRDITGGDALAVVTFAFPQKYDDGGPLENADSFAGTGMTDINRKQNGFNGVYYIRAVESSFTNGLFTQKLIGHADPLTQEQDVIEFISMIEAGNSASGTSALEQSSASTPNTDTNLNTRDTATSANNANPLLTQTQNRTSAAIPNVPADLNLITQADAAKLQGTNSELAKKAMQTLQTAREQGLDVRVTEGYRSLEKQAQLYAQGRTAPGNIVTNARAGQSKHNSGNAVDMGVYDNGKYVARNDDPRYSQLGAIGKAQGLKWGGDFKSIPDKPHFELNF
jgi:LAS superfamily LD-carboxypeptidase LdcB